MPCFRFNTQFIVTWHWRKELMESFERVILLSIIIIIYWWVAKRHFVKYNFKGAELINSQTNHHITYIYLFSHTPFFIHICLDCTIYSLGIPDFVCHSYFIIFTNLHFSQWFFILVLFHILFLFLYFYLFLPFFLSFFFSAFLPFFLSLNCWTC